jgi:hypothetical protein
MRAHTITTKSRPRRKARYSVLALVLGVCALAIPATASGDSTQPDDGGAVAAGNAHRTPTELAQATSTAEPTSVSGIDSSQAKGIANDTGRAFGPHGALLDTLHATRPAVVSGSSASTGGGFDWASAAVGAGAAMALVALAGAALLTIRRRAPVSPSAPTS